MSNPKPDEQLIKSYVFHKDRCFYVSTINRDSSAPLGTRYAETLIWDFDPEKREAKSMMYQRESLLGSIRRHLEVCAELFETGELKPEEF